MVKDVLIIFKVDVKDKNSIHKTPRCSQITPA